MSNTSQVLMNQEGEGAWLSSSVQRAKALLPWVTIGKTGSFFQRLSIYGTFFKRQLLLLIRPSAKRKVSRFLSG
jgi:hypothetical protein